MERRLAAVTTTLIGTTLVAFVAWYGANWQSGGAPNTEKGISKSVQQETSQALTVEIAAVTKSLDHLDTRSTQLKTRIAALDPLQAPSASSLQSNELIERRELLDPGPSPSELARQKNRTPSGISTRALEAYTRETGIDPKRIEALMQ